MSEQPYSEEEALKYYDVKKYRTPDGYTADIAIFTISNDDKEHCGRLIQILLIRRAELDGEGRPNIEAGKWALPGGFISPGETAIEAAARELFEETGVKGLHLKSFGVYDKAGRDPRGWMITNAHYAAVPEYLLDSRLAGDDAAEVQLFSLQELKKLDLAFDHRQIIGDALEQMKLDMVQTALAKEFLPEEFTLSELRNVLLCAAEDILDESVKSEPFFWRKAPRLPFIEAALNDDGIHKTTQRNSKYKTKLYRFNDFTPIKSIYK